MDWEGPLPAEDIQECVIVPPVLCPLSEEDFHNLQQTIPNDVHHTNGDGSFGLNTYARVRAFVQGHLL